MKLHHVALLLCMLFWRPGFAVDVHDDLGMKISLDAPAERIVTLSPHATELAVAAGLQDKLVAISLGGDPPPGLEALPRIGGAGAVDRERLLALRPDLVIAWASGNRPQDLAWLIGNGIAVYRSEPGRLEQIASAIVSLGRLGGTEEIANQKAGAFHRAIQTPCGASEKQTVYVVVWERPAMTVGGQHWLNDVLHRAGYRNRFADQARGIFAITNEARLASDGLRQISLVRRHDGSETDRLADQLSVPGPRLAEAMQTLCRRRMGDRADSINPG